MNTIKYKGYAARIEFDADDRIFVGHLAGIRDIVGFHGSSVEELENALNNGPFEAGKPNFIIAHTIKGKGVSYMEGVTKWHHGVPSAEQYALALSELTAAEALI